MKPSLVVVRDYAGKPRLARVCRDRGAVVDVVSSGVQSIANEGEKEPPPVGFRRADVFRYSRELLESGNWSIGEPL